MPNWIIQKFLGRHEQHATFFRIGLCMVSLQRSGVILEKCLSWVNVNVLNLTTGLEFDVLVFKFFDGYFLKMYVI